nr:MAG TPA: hypothetical protein [Caudoviricetes sp.]
MFSPKGGYVAQWVVYTVVTMLHGGEMDACRK